MFKYSNMVQLTNTYNVTDNRHILEEISQACKLVFELSTQIITSLPSANSPESSFLSLTMTKYILHQYP